MYLVFYVIRYNLMACYVYCVLYYLKYKLGSPQILKQVF